ncbi:coiled-coil domain-containing protein 137-like [Watersipora subatra]|uniref:coiled-coil domain-containing protein 137-like n=1 Tax=Watersipora subatra TaxID=2589382 RepID=UPI00355AE4F0
MAVHRGKSKNGQRKGKPTRQPSLLKKPVIKVSGKLGKAQKSKKRKIKKMCSSTVEFYEPHTDNERNRTTRPHETVLDAAPKMLDQEMPKKVREMIRFKRRLADEANLSKRKVKASRMEDLKKRHSSTDSWFKRPLSDVPKFKRKTGESDRAFYSRVEVESNEFMKIAKYETDNECKVIENEMGNLEVVSRPRRRQLKNKEYREKRKIKKMSKDLSDENAKDFSDLRDEVKFNERTDRPPQDLALPRKAKETAKATKLSSLKFMSLIDEKVMGKKSDPPKSLAYKERMQEERQRVIDLYRDIKTKKRATALT